MLLLSANEKIRTVYAGSKILLLAEVELDIDGTTTLRNLGHVRQKSDELFEDLEIQLGSSQVTYLRIQVSYAHSAFPEFLHTEHMTGVSSMSSRMETVVQASIKRHSTISPWSPRPVPLTNPLFPLIERHWGPDKARDAMQQILAKRSTPRKPAKAAPRTSPSPSIHTDYSDRKRSIRKDLEPPSIPIRHASWLKGSIEAGTLSRNGSASSAQLRTVKGEETYKRDWTVTPSSSHSPRSRPPWKMEPSFSEGSRSSLEKRRSVGPKGLASLVPRLTDFTTESRNARERQNPLLPTSRVKSKRVSGRWSWVSWF